MRESMIVILEPCSDQAQNGFCARKRIYLEIIALEGAHKYLRRAVTSVHPFSPNTRAGGRGLLCGG